MTSGMKKPFSFSTLYLKYTEIPYCKIFLYMFVGTAPSINGQEVQQLPFWLMNIPRNQWPDQCPEFLINSSERDKKIMSVPNDQYQRATWEEVQEYIRSFNLTYKGSRKCCWSISPKGTNRLDRFTRLPSDLRRYREYIYKLKQDYGAVINFIVEKRLQWKGMEPEDKTPFGNPSTRSICFCCLDIYPAGINPFSYYNTDMKERWHQNPVQRLAIWSWHQYYPLGHLDQVSIGRGPCYGRFDGGDEREGWGLHPAGFLWENVKGKCMLWQFGSFEHILEFTNSFIFIRSSGSGTGQH